MTHLEWLKKKRVKTEVIKRTKNQYAHLSHNHILDKINRDDLSMCFSFFTEGQDKGEYWRELNDEWLVYNQQVNAEIVKGNLYKDEYPEPNM